MIIKQVSPIKWQARFFTKDKLTKVAIEVLRFHLTSSPVESTLSKFGFIHSIKGFDRASKPCSIAYNSTYLRRLTKPKQSKSNSHDNIGKSNIHSSSQNQTNQPLITEPDE